MRKKKKMKGVLSVEMDGWENGHQREDSGGKHEEQKAFGEPSILFLQFFYLSLYLEWLHGSCFLF